MSTSRIRFESPSMSTAKHGASQAVRLGPCALESYVLLHSIHGRLYKPAVCCFCADHPLLMRQRYT